MSEPDQTVDVEMLQHANSALRRLGELDREEAEIQALYDAEQERIGLWYEDRTSGIDRYREELHHQLREIARREHERTGSKTIKLPHGELQLRAQQATVVETGELDVTSLPDELVRVPPPPAPKLAKQAVKDRCQPGAIIDDPATPEGYEYRAAVDRRSGEVIKGVMFVVPTTDAFKAVTS